MSDFFTRLIERTQGVALVAKPLIPPMFAPVSTTLSDYPQNSTQNSESFKSPSRAILISPSDNPSSAALNQPFRKTSKGRLTPSKQNESDLSEKIEAVSPQALKDQIESGIIVPSSNLMRSKDQTRIKRQKELFDNNEQSINNTLSENDQNTSLVPEQSFKAEKDISGKPIDSGQVNLSQDLPKVEEDQNTDRRLKQLNNERRDESGALIKFEHVNVSQEMAESESDRNIDLYHESSLNEKRLKRLREELIESDQESALREITELKLNQNIDLKHEDSLEEKQDVSGRLIDIDKVSALREKIKANNGQSISLSENSLEEKQNVSGRLVDTEKVNASRVKTETNNDQSSPQPERLLNEKHEASGEPGYLDQASASREIIESSKIKSADTLYLKPYSRAEIRLQQAADMKTSSAEPTIKVTISRVEVRAIMPPASTPPTSRARTRSPILSLDDYLKQRNERQR
jgi:hypothetical protein